MFNIQKCIFINKDRYAYSSLYINFLNPYNMSRLKDKGISILCISYFLLICRFYFGAGSPLHIRYSFGMESAAKMHAGTNTSSRSSVSEMNRTVGSGVCLRSATTDTRHSFSSFLLPEQQAHISIFFFKSFWSRHVKSKNPHTCAHAGSNLWSPPPQLCSALWRVWPGHPLGTRSEGTPADRKHLQRRGSVRRRALNKECDI